MMTREDQIKTVVDLIKSDETILSWARYSIRYNNGRTRQAEDFLCKMQNHSINPLCAQIHTLSNVNIMAGALKQIEHEDTF